jgi:glycosyltransferase involved in cell wall biosynthesis
MNIDVLDYAGHPCQAQLSKALASRGHEVRHLHCPDYVSGKGSLQSHAADPASYTVKSLSLGTEFNRYNPLTRVCQEIRFGLVAAAAIRRRKPDVVLLSNVPLIANFVLSRLVSVAKLPMVFWQQDVYSRAIAVSAENRLGFTGRLIGRAADRVERDIARRSAGVIPITDAFVPTLRRWKVDDARIATIPNWAPIDEMPCLPRRNAWSMDHDLDGRHVLLYSGTLGLKHDPSILLRIARLLHAEDPDARLVVVSEGAGRSWLEEHKGPDLPQLVLADYQPYDVLPEVLASADILIAILEPAAGYSRCHPRYSATCVRVGRRSQ